MAAARKIILTKLKLQVTLSMQYYIGIHILWYKNLNFLWKKSGDEAKVAQCPMSLLSIASFISDGPLISIH